jgi:protein-disulfide isomerase
MNRFVGLAAGAALWAVLSGAAVAQDTPAPEASPGISQPDATAPAAGATVAPGAPAADGSVDPAALEVAGPLGDKGLGDPKAPVTVIEYASMTCNHCAAFHVDTFPAFKAKYIDTGKVRYILREFPLDPLAAAAFMVARCAPDEHYFPLIALMFEKQQAWAFVQNPADALFRLVGPTGYEEAKFKTCIADQNLLNGVLWVANRGDETFKIRGTPTFFVNGKRTSGALSMEEVDKLIEPLL